MKASNLIGKTIVESFLFHGIIMTEDIHLYLRFSDGTDCIIEGARHDGNDIVALYHNMRSQEAIYNGKIENS